ncbi:tRNA dimethylallyltransferase [Aquimarina brevivitae]|uniref:tRNA dimethylallyltransferase n=2 Tax=Aquimarina brevivitae TaxID=323412 RepID=A0A4Q7NZC4_9FLAO|nr:tRNA dimethylallyltransferase [Aquimarina brevivitae]
MVPNTVITVEKPYIMTKKHLIVIVGPTAIGKTALSIALAKAFNCEIVSADSRQFFAEMNIGTAVPTEEELAEAKHHFIQHLSITDTYSVGDFERDGVALIESLFTTNDYVIIVGGSGLYVDAITKGLDHFPDVDPSIREHLQSLLEQEGISALQSKLKELDPEHYQKVDLNNTHRVIRALEICIGTGKTYTSFLSNPKKKRSFNVTKIGLSADRQLIYDRINKRVDMMMKEGLLEEVKTLEKYRNLNALNTVGYKELFNYLDGAWDLDFAVSEIKKNTRRFAKRQLTWFRKDDSITWFDYKTAPKEIVSYIKKNS